MRKQLFFYIALATITSLSIIKTDNCNSRNDSANTEITSRSYMSVRPQFQSVSPELLTAFREDRLHAREDGWQGAFQIVPFGGSSLLSDKMQRYFTPFGKISLIVDESNPNANAPENVERDLMATNFNVFTKNQNFRSIISFEPRQTTFGIGLHYRQSFWRCEQKRRGFFFSISTPLTHLNNEFKLIEKVTNDGGGIDKNLSANAVANMTEAFNQPEWNFGRIASNLDSCSSWLKKTGLADIEVKLGMEWLEREPCHLESYIGILIPTGNKPQAKYLFEPIVGNGQHVGFMCGTYFGARIWHDEEKGREIRAEYATHSNYLFMSRQVRSFDLRYKQFSRYMPVYINKEQAEEANALFVKAQGLAGPERITLLNQAQNLATPGINVFTQQVDVTPGFQYNITSSLVFTSCRGFQAEGGYNFFAHRAELVKLACPWVPGPALKHFNGNGLTNPVRDISGILLLETALPQPDPYPLEHGLNNYENNMIQENDLDLTSASTPCALSHTFFGSLGYRWDDREYPLMTNFGGSYEFSNANNASIERWTLWAKFGVSF